MVQQVFQKVNEKAFSYFDFDEFLQVLEVYNERVGLNEWHNYGVICADRATTFVVLDNERDIASFSKLKNGQFIVSCEGYSLETEHFDQALKNFKTDFGNKKRKNPALKVVS